MFVLRSLERIILLASTVLLILEVINVEAIWPSPRTHAECVYVWPKAKIYCYGGDIEACNTNITSINKNHKNKDGDDNLSEESCNKNSTGFFYSLDISRNSNISSLQFSWELLDRDGPHPGQNKFFTLSPITAGNNQIKIVMNGGYHGENWTLTQSYSTAMYDIMNNGSWTPVTTVNDLTPINSYGHNAVVYNDSVVCFHGGASNSISFVSFMKPSHKNSNDIVTWQGLDPELFVETVFSFDVKRTMWGTINAAYETYNENGTIFHKAVLGNDDIIYYIGGLQTNNSWRNQGEGELDTVGLYSPDTFDIRSGVWGQPNWGEQEVCPQGRIHHSANLLPSTNEILVFGGMNPNTDGILPENHLWIFDTEKEKWRIQNLSQEDPLNSDSAITMGHYGHSAIVAEPYLFIMFGRDHADRPTNRTWIIDTRSWQWVTSISKVDPTPPVKVPVYHDVDDDNSDDDNIHRMLYIKITGGIVGVTAGLLIIVAMYLYFTKKSCFAKRNKQTTSTERRERLDALHGGESHDNANSDRNSNVSLSDSLPPYSLHDDGHRLPKMYEINDAT